MKNIKLIAVIVLALLSLSLAQSNQSVIEDRTIFVERDGGEPESQVLSRYSEADALISKNQAVEIAQQALFKFSAPDSITLGLEKDGEQAYLVWKVMFGEFIARVNAGTGYALTGYVDNPDNN